MPIYVYVCDDCDVEFEELKPMSRADEVETCPICRRLISRAPTAAAYLRGLPAPVDSAARSAAHAADCDCCVPMRGR
jgi:putative FmdB family regulatory protein